MSYGSIVAALDEGRPFAFARYGDGELACMMDRKMHGGRNIDKHRYFADLGAALIRTIAKPKDYHYALQGLVRRNRAMTRFLRAKSPLQTWGRADVLHHASWKGNLLAFALALRARSAKIVGPPHISTPMRTVMVPARNCWTEAKATANAIMQQHKPGDVWVFCCSMMAKCLIYDMHGLLKDATLLDAGSLLDPYFGRRSRNYHKTINKEALKKVRRILA